MTNNNQTEQLAEQQVATEAAEQTPKSRKKLYAIAGGALVLLVAAAGISIPLIQQQARNSEYNDTVAATAEAYTQADAANTGVAALDPLTILQLDELGTVVSALEQLGAVSSDIIPEKQAVELKSAAELVAAAAPEANDDDAAFIAEFAVKVKENPQNDPAVDELPETWFGADIEAAAIFAEPVTKSPKVTQVDSKITSDVLADAKEQLAVAEAAQAKAGALLDEREARSVKVNAAATLALPALKSTAKAIIEPAKKFSEAQSKASDEQRAAVTKAAVISVGSDSAAVVEAIDALNAYVAAANAAKTAHDTVVAEEKVQAEAEAATQGATGYTDPGTGTWTPVENWGGNAGGGWVNPGSAGSGGGSTWTPPSSNGGGGGAATPPAPIPGGGGGGHTCPAPPAGWYPDGGSNGGCPTYTAPTDNPFG